MIYKFEYKEKCESVSTVSITANSLKEALLKYFGSNDSFSTFNPDKEFKSLSVEVE